MTPVVVESIAGLDRSRAEHAGRIGLVPTMGALHAGHARLIERARRENAQVIVSVFVNPLQFNQPSDLDTYPRTLTADVAMCGDLGVDVVFAPTVAEMYPVPPDCAVDVGHLADHLCGRFRPGHFRGVATVVLKLLNIVRPGAAYFGQKDAQQLAIVRRLVHDFNVAVSIVGVETVREADGLALSSRNTRLTPAERQIAPALHAALEVAVDHIANGMRAVAEIRAAAVRSIPSSDLLRLEYFDIVDPETLQPVDAVEHDVLIAGAMWVGSTRLIDNVQARPPERTLK